MGGKGRKDDISWQSPWTIGSLCACFLILDSRSALLGPIAFLLTLTLIHSLTHTLSYSLTDPGPLFVLLYGYQAPHPTVAYTLFPVPGTLLLCAS
jgi:hypothetical protein